MPSKSKALVVNGWNLFVHPLFLSQFEDLLRQVEQLAQKNPGKYQRKNATKRLAAVVKLAFEKIPRDPTLNEYRLGASLGDEHRHWFRAKFFQQYRLFFRFHVESKIIVYAWINDETTKRAYESKTDAYLTFKKMLKRGRPPSDWEALVKEAVAWKKRLT